MENPQDIDGINDGNLMINTGALVIFVLDAGGALPIADATVSIYKSGSIDEKPIAVLKSGENGKTDIIYLETPQIPENSTQILSTLPYELYDVIVDLNNYYQIISRNIPIYPSVMSIQPIYMVPRPLDSGTATKEMHNSGSESSFGGVADV